MNDEVDINELFDIISGWDKAECEHSCNICETPTPLWGLNDGICKECLDIISQNPKQFRKLVIKLKKLGNL